MRRIGPALGIYDNVLVVAGVLRSLRLGNDPERQSAALTPPDSAPVRVGVNEQRRPLPPSCAKNVARCTDVTVLPTPPLCEVTVSMISALLHLRATTSTKYTQLTE